MKQSLFYNVHSVMYKKERIILHLMFSMGVLFAFSQTEQIRIKPGITIFSWTNMKMHFK